MGAPVGLVGVLRGRLMACMACPCYAVGAYKTCRRTAAGRLCAAEGTFFDRLDALSVERQWVFWAFASLMACMARPRYAAGGAGRTGTHGQVRWAL
ncbi:hypothetical protein H5410_063986 [Solanum commersonii]|uniref:Uncharacterized protein n=1 Tax=Solanum commersonii TaxID=4109 RepID=A0A9J5W1C6_SOLCO|nr:hypothetical protein H5410_063986 [Solanum commersonii]